MASSAIAGALLNATFDERGLASLVLLATASVLNVEGDAFALSLNGTSTILSSSLPVPTRTFDAHGQPTYRYSAAGDLTVHVAYSVTDAFVSKQLTVSSARHAHNVTNVTLFAGARLLLDGAAPAESVVARSPAGLKDFALFARWSTTGALITARNPFLTATPHGGGGVTLSYEPMMPVAPAAPFSADRAHIGLHLLTQRKMAPPAQPLDEAEHAAMQRCVRAAIAAPQRASSVKINVGWCENDFQIDISTAAGRAEYKRIIDRAASLGIESILFAPRNSDVSSIGNGTDAWGWEQVLWFGMGERLRMGLWAPGDPLPASLTEMLDYFRLRGVRPVAYVYPILAFLAGTLPGGASPPWVVHGTYSSSDLATKRLGLGPMRSDLASPALQQWLPKTMRRFADQTGAGGFSFDYTYFEQGSPGGRPWRSQYAQWSGWRAILAALQQPKACAGRQCVVDNRQANHAWGPWMWAEGGTYAEPLQSDEQPGSWMFYEADLKTDRLSANRQRETAWSYRVQSFAPAEVVPGFALHQTDRDVSPAQKNVTAGPGCPRGGGTGRCAELSRRRDFDLLGYRYSLLSAVGTGGANLVLNMLPARDEGEFAAFPAEDVAFFRQWLEWADRSRDLVASTRVLPSTSRPAAGSLDGVSLLRQDGSCTGAIFAFSPTATPLNLSLALDASLGCSPPHPSSGVPGLLLLRQIGSSDRSEPAGGWARQLLRAGDALALTVPPTTALALELEPFDGASLVAPLVLGAAAGAASLSADGALSLSRVVGEQGAAAELTVLLPPHGPGAVSRATLNGKVVRFDALPPLDGRPPAVRIRGAWAGERFGRAHEIVAAGGFSGGRWTGTFSVPAAVLEQLAARNRSYDLSYDLDPNSNDEANVPWLAPGRLLIWAKYKPLLNDSFNAAGSIDGTPLLMRKAYNTIAPSRARFIGHWADVTRLIKPGVQQTLALQLPPGLKPQGVHFENVESLLSDEAALLQGTEELPNLRTPRGVEEAT